MRRIHFHWDRPMSGGQNRSPAGNAACGTELRRRLLKPVHFSIVRSEGKSMPSFTKPELNHPRRVMQGAFAILMMGSMSIVGCSRQSADPAQDQTSRSTAPMPQTAPSRSDQSTDQQRKSDTARPSTDSTTPPSGGSTTSPSGGSITTPPSSGTTSGATPASPANPPSMTPPSTQPSDSTGSSTGK